MTTFACPCGSGRGYAACCGPYLEGAAHAPDPERLMRSRYTAFCRKDAAYLMATQDDDGKDPADLRQALEATMASTRWLGLLVISSRMQGPDRGWVEFAAFFSQAGQRGQLHEQSLFLRREGAWIYRAGEALPAVRLGRNQACFCGSGKKYKKCHGRGEA